ncbi:hypothetical protein IT575_14740 [bacterium]|nr:hypothetical protein [bacterium]
MSLFEREMQWPDYSEERIGLLPRPWIFFRDPAFWLCLPLLLLMPAILASVWLGSPGALAHWGFWLLLVLAVLHPLSLLWLLWDSHRWDLPRRGMLLLYFMLSIGMYLAVYLSSFRGEWLMHIANEQRNR